MKETKERPGAIICALCGAPVPVKPGRGRLPEKHVECIQAESAMRRLQRFLEHEANWQDAHHLKKFRGEMFRMLNQLANAKTLTFPQTELPAMTDSTESTEQEN